jgi:hypothetical protein
VAGGAELEVFAKLFDEGLGWNEESEVVLGARL